MPQVEKEKTGGGASGRNVGESIETEKQQQGGRATDSGGDCVGGPVETFVASGSSSSASRASSSSRSASSSVSPQPPPLTLIDANVASSAGEQQQQKQRSRAPQSLSPASSDKSHQDSLARRSQQRKRATRGEQVGSGSARALDKLSGLDKQPQQQPLSGSRYHDKASGQVELGAAKDSQRLAELRAEAEAAAAAAAKKKAEEEKDEDELNNNSIHLVRAAAAATHAVAHRSHQQQQRESGQSVKSPNASLSPPIKHSQAQQTKEISPLSLLTGLRMHTNNLRNQQQQAQGGNGESNHQQSRNPQTSGNNELHSSQSQSQSHRAPLTVSGANRFAASPATTTSPASFVESSLNPDDDDGGGGGAEAARQPGGYVPSYTSIFNKPISPPSSERQQQQVSSITTTSRLSESTSRMVTNRSPLRKQSAQFDLSSTSANSRSLFAAPPPPPPSASAKQETTTTTRRLPLLLRAPDYSRRPLNAETFDCDDLEAGNSAGRGNLESSEEDDDHHHHQDMNDLELDDVDDLEEEEELDEKSPFSGRRPQPPSHLNQLANRSSRPAGLSNSRDSVRRATDNQQQQQHDKYPGSAKLSRHLGNQKQPASSAQSHRGAMSVKKQQMAQATSPQAQHTKISIGEMSRPPSFNTTTGQCQNQQKASCRKLDLLEQVAHLECSCHICSKNRKLTSLHDNLYYHTHLSSNGKLSQFDFSNSSSAKLHKIDKGYPKTHFMHLVLKSIILILCMLLLLLVLVGSIMLSISLPHSMDKVVNATRSFNVTIAGR